MINRVCPGMESLRSPKAVFEAVAYTAIEWMLIASCYLCVMRSFGGIFRVWPRRHFHLHGIRGLRDAGAATRNRGWDASGFP